MKKTLVIALASLNLAACTSVEGLRPDIAAKPLPSRLDEIAYINDLRSAYTTDNETGLAEDLCFTGKGLDAFKSKSGEGYQRADDPENFTSKASCLRFKRLNSETAETRIREYLAAGFGLTDIYCERFFTVASASKQNRVFGQNFANGVDSLVGAALSLSGAGSTATGIVNSGFGLIDSTFEAYDTAFLIGPEFSEVRRLVLAAQNDYRRKTYSNEGANLPITYSGARSTVERYAGFCSNSGMKELVSKAVNDKSDALTSVAQGSKKAIRIENIQEPPETQ